MKCLGWKKLQVQGVQKLEKYKKIMQKHYGLKHGNEIYIQNLQFLPTVSSPQGYIRPSLLKTSCFSLFRNFLCTHLETFNFDFFLLSEIEIWNIGISKALIKRNKDSIMNITTNKNIDVWTTPIAILLLNTNWASTSVPP